MNAPNLHKRANLLWLWILPAALAWLLIASLRPAFWPAVVIGGGCCLAGGVGLAWRRFPTARQRFWGGLFFTGSSLSLVFSLAFLGCLPFLAYNAPPTPASIEATKRQEEALLRQAKESVARQIVPRDALADASMLDLTPFYNQLLPGQRPPTNAFSHYPSPGIYTWLGVTFDVRGMVQDGFYGRALTNHIPVGRKCVELDFLHATQGIGPQHSTNSQYVVHFANGINLTMPILYGEDVAWGFQTGRLDGRAINRSGGGPANRVVWGERTGPTLSGPQPMYAFYIKRWPNPLPNEIVDAVDFEPGPANPVPNLSAFLVAITVKPLPDQKP